MAGEVVAKLRRRATLPEPGEGERGVPLRACPTKRLNHKDTNDTKVGKREERIGVKHSMVGSFISKQPLLSFLPTFVSFVSLWFNPLRCASFEPLEGDMSPPLLPSHVELILNPFVSNLSDIRALCHPRQEPSLPAQKRGLFLSYPVAGASG